MATAEKRRLTAQEYLARERAADFRSEFFNGEIFAMSGATWVHNLITSNLAAEIRDRLKGGPCRVVTSDQRVKVSATGLYTYPDIVIACGEPEFEDNVLDTLLNPRIIVEVLSESTEKYDRGIKFEHYRRLPSVQELMLVSQDRPLVERYVRGPDDTWTLTDFRELDDVVSFGSVAAKVPMKEIYSGVTFPADPPAEVPPETSRRPA